MRLNLYSRLQRLETEDAVAAFADELADRFGPPPEPVRTLLDLQSLKLAAGARGVCAVKAGPKAIAVEFQRQPGEEAWARLTAEGRRIRRGDRLIDETPTEAGVERLDRARRLLHALDEAA